MQKLSNLLLLFGLFSALPAFRSPAAPARRPKSAGPQRLLSSAKGPISALKKTVFRGLLRKLTKIAKKIMRIPAGTRLRFIRDSLYKKRSAVRRARILLDELFGYRKNYGPDFRVFSPY